MSRICRVCLQRVDVLYTKRSQTTVIHCLFTALRSILPEMNLDISKNAGICFDCFRKLHIAVQFRKTCLETEKKIRKVREEKGIAPPINLEDVPMSKSEECHMNLNETELRGNKPQPNGQSANKETQTEFTRAISSTIPPLSKPIEFDKPDLIDLETIRAEISSATYESAMIDHDYINSPRIGRLISNKICNICQAANSDESHMRRHNANKYKQCPFCKIKFSHAEFLNNHIVSHLTVCDKCGNQVPMVHLKNHQNSGLGIDIPQHQFKKVLICVQCSQTFNNAILYEAHLKKHRKVPKMQDEFVF